MFCPKVVTYDNTCNLPFKLDNESHQVPLKGSIRDYRHEQENVINKETRLGVYSYTSSPVKLYLGRYQIYMLTS